MPRRPFLRLLCALFSAPAPSAYAAAAPRVLIVGLRLPPNYGPAYVRRFETIYADVARERRAALVPFLFEGFAEDDAMFQPDRIHPVSAAQARLLDNVWRELKPLLGEPAK